MTPASPVIAAYQDEEIVLAKDQPEYIPLPVLPIGEPAHGVLLTRWRLSWSERWRVLLRGDLFLQVMTFNQPLQPVCLIVDPPQASSDGGLVAGN